MIERTQLNFTSRSPKSATPTSTHGLTGISGVAKLLSSSGCAVVIFRFLDAWRKVGVEFWITATRKANCAAVLLMGNDSYLKYSLSLEPNVTKAHY